MKIEWEIRKEVGYGFNMWHLYCKDKDVPWPGLCYSSRNYICSDCKKEPPDYMKFQIKLLLGR